MRRSVPLAECKICSADGALQPGKVCLYCLSGSAVLARAAIWRQLPRHNFTITGAAAAGRALPPITIGDSFQKAISIKACEYLRHELQAAVAEGITGDTFQCISRQQPADNAGSTPRRKNITTELELRHRILTACHRKCSYCGTPMSLDEIDTVLPCHFEHGNGLGGRRLLYQLQESIGNLTAACAACNGAKGECERRGLFLLRSLLRGVSQFAAFFLPSMQLQMPFASDHFTIPPPVSAAPDISEGRRPSTAIQDWEDARNLLHYVAWRFSCPADLIRGGEYTTLYSPGLRHVLFVPRHYQIYWDEHIFIRLGIARFEQLTNYKKKKRT